MVEAGDAVGGRYELRELIGRGGMAVVHRGFDRVLHRDVAVKTMHSTLVGSSERQRFVAETRVMAGLNDPRLVTLLDAGVDGVDPGSRPWFVMELVRGPSLSSVLADGPLLPADAARVGAGVAAGLAHVHAAGVVHRDVKPANILLTPTGEPKLADFGVARAMGDDEGLTDTGQAIGTAAYLAPEQISGEPVTGASDVYALGLVLLEALTGQRAYPGTAQEAAFARLHHGPTIPVSLGAVWTHLLAQMTASDPAHRPAAAEVAARLADLEAETAVRPTGGRQMALVPAEVETGGLAQIQRPRRSRALKAAALAVASVVVAGGLLWATYRSPGSSPVASAAATDLAPSATPSAARRVDRPRPARSSTVAVLSSTPPSHAPTRHPHPLPGHHARHRHAHAATRRPPHRARQHPKPHEHWHPHEHPHGHGHRHDPHHREQHSD